MEPKWDSKKINSKVKKKRSEDTLLLLLKRKKKYKLNQKGRKASQFLEFWDVDGKRLIPRKCVHGKSVHAVFGSQTQLPVGYTQTQARVCQAGWKTKGNGRPVASWHYWCQVNTFKFLKILKETTEKYMSGSDRILPVDYQFATPNAFYTSKL